MKKMAPRLGGLGKGGRRWLWDVIQIVHQLLNTIDNSLSKQHYIM